MSNTKRPNLSKYWDKVCFRMLNQPYYINDELGQYKQREFFRILDKWVDRPLTLSLKTDSFEEAFGTDKIMYWIAQRSKKTIGLDISQEIISEAKNNIGSEQLVWVATDIARMPFRDNTFDFIFSSSTYGYLDNIAMGLREAYRILKPEGILVISINNKYNILFGAITNFFIYLRKIPFSMSKTFIPRHFKTLLERAGFKVDGYEPIVHIPPFLNSFINFLRKGRNSVISEVIIKKLKEYSREKINSRYFTSWFIVFRARKPT